MSYAIYVGRDLMADGHAVLAGYGDEPSGHWLEIAPRRQHPPDSVIEVGSIPLAATPGVRSVIPQVAHGAGAVRFDSKVEGGPAGEGGERYFDYVRLVRGGDATSTPEGDPAASRTGGTSAQAAPSPARAGASTIDQL